MLSIDIKSQIVRQVISRSGKRKILTRAADWTKNHVRHRVQVKGKGASGLLKGYSTNPITMKYRGRNKAILLNNTKGKWGRYPGGYKQYKEHTGQESELFQLSNKGNLWKSWDRGGANSGDSVVIGFASAAEGAIATEHQENGREDMFDLNTAEIKMLEKAVADVIEDIIVGITSKVKL